MKKTVRILAVLLAAVMLVGTLAGCTKTKSVFCQCDGRTMRKAGGGKAFSLPASG